MTSWWRSKFRELCAVTSTDVAQEAVDRAELSRQASPLLIPTPQQIEPILDDFLPFDGPTYPELRRRCAQRIFDLCAVMSGAFGAAQAEQVAAKVMQVIDKRIADYEELESRNDLTGSGKHGKLVTENIKREITLALSSTDREADK